MPAMKITLDGDRAWPDLGSLVCQGGPPVQVTEDVEIVTLAGGMTSGAPSVAIRLNLPDGSVAIAQTSLALLLTAADAFRARHGDPRR